MVKKNYRYISLLLFFLALLLVSFILSNHASAVDIMFSDDFETDLSKWVDWGTSNTPPTGFSLTADEKHNGSKSLYLNGSIELVKDAVNMYNFTDYNDMYYSWYLKLNDGFTSHEYYPLFFYFINYDLDYDNGMAISVENFPYLTTYIWVNSTEYKNITDFLISDNVWAHLLIHKIYDGNFLNITFYCDGIEFYNYSNTTDFTQDINTVEIYHQLDIYDGKNSTWVDDLEIYGILSDVVYVDDDAPLGWYDETHVKTIQEGINNVSSSGIVYIWNGTYIEDVIINKPISIIGNGSNNTIIYNISSNNYGLFRLYADNITIANLRISGVNNPLSVGIRFYNSSNVNISNCLIDSCKHGIYARYSTQDNITFYNNTLINCSSYGIYLYTGTNNVSILNNTILEISWYGLYAYNVDNLTISYNYFLNSTIEFSSSTVKSNYVINNNEIYCQSVGLGTYGISFWGGKFDKIFIYNNTINNVAIFGLVVRTNYQFTNSLIYNNYFFSINTDAIEGFLWMVELTAFPHTGTKFYDNTIYCENLTGFAPITGDMYDYSDLTGIHIDGGEDLEIYNNSISGFRTGVWFWVGRGNTTIRNNYIFDNSIGISMYDASTDDNIIYSNYIYNNEWGFYADAGNDNNLIYNNFFDNINNSYDKGNNIWNISKTLGTNIIGGPYLGGNYWSDYNGSDVDGDGLGDTPYYINSPADYHPLWWGSCISMNLTNLSVDYNGTTQTLNFSWDGNPAFDRYVVRNSSDWWAYTPWMGSELYNGSNTSVTVSNLTQFYYYTVWGYNNITGLWSCYPLLVEWGAKAIMVYDENSTLDLFNYTVFITNRNGSQTYQKTNCNNPLYLSLQDIPYGNDTVFLISCPYYQSRIYYEDLLMNHFYYNRFYLPPLYSVVEPGAGDIDNTSMNMTWSRLYFLTVVNEYSDTVDDCFIEVRRYIPSVGSAFPPFFDTTVIDRFEVVSSFYTDGNGQHEVYLIPNVLYKIFLFKDGYYDAIADYVPDRELRTHTFKLYFLSSMPIYDIDLFHNITWYYTPVNSYQNDAFNFSMYVDSADSQLEWFNVSVYVYNDTTSLWVLVNYTNSTSASGGYINFSFTNASAHYKIYMVFKKIGFPPCTLVQSGSLDYWVGRTRNWSFGIPDIVFVVGLLIVMLLVMGFLLPYAGVSTGYIGIGIFALGLFFKPDISIGGVGGWMIFGLMFFMYSIGVFLWSRL